MCLTEYNEKEEREQLSQEFREIGNAEGENRLSTLFTKLKELGKEDDIDLSYYENMAQEALKDIIVYGDYVDFLDLSKPYVYETDDNVSGEKPFMNPPENEVPLELPFK